ncbi:MAG: hypothetical protein IPF54_18900 [Draconibacterium sp.]|nr:hypothetical protein [Draconibacterium sp.]
MDIVMDTVPNLNNSVVKNNQTTTSFKYSTNQDTYIIFCIAMAVDAYIPEAEGIISTLSVAGVVPGTDVLPGQEIEYSVEIRNKGTEPINNAVMTIPIPYTGEFVSTSGIFYEGLSGSQPAFVANVGANGSIVWNFGNMPMLNPSSTLLGKLKFKVKVTEDCFILSNPNCPPKITVPGSSSGVGAISGVTYSDKDFIQGYTSEGICIGEPITEPIEFPIIPTDYIVQNCSDQDYSTQTFTYCNITESTIPFAQVIGNFPAGSRYFDDINLSTGEPKPSSNEFTNSSSFPASNGTKTYYAIPPGLNQCFFSIYNYSYKYPNTAISRK